MQSETIPELRWQAECVPRPNTSPRWDRQFLEVNVIHTDPQSTCAALRFAESFASGLNASIHLLAVLSVPRQFPIDRPPVSVEFIRRRLCEMVGEYGSPAGRYFLHICISRSRVDTLLQVLRPNSLVVLASGRRFWPTVEKRLSSTLRAHGHNVMLVKADQAGMGR